ncbi:MAG: hypothetical protein GY910_07005 [bacterium]|nr:hypothetical protein [Deltaproteobacteria bacterium]MCP4904713.1 hypothetical protein [bacterium]
MRAHRPARFLASLAAAALLFSAAPAAAIEWEGSTAENILAKTIDAAIVRPLASVRVVLGGILAVPAMILASPSGKEGIDGAYEVLLSQPIEYAFARELGDF